MFGFNLNMQINSNSSLSVQKLPSFRGERICSVGLRKLVNGRDKYIPAFFTRLTKEDEGLINRIKSIWENKFYARIIVSDFLRCLREPLPREHKYKRFFMVEDPNSLRPDDRIKSLAMVLLEDESLYLSFLQSASSLKLEDKVSGGGVAMIYGLTKIAQKMGLKEIRLTSANFETDVWYKRLGFTSKLFGKTYEMYLPQKKFAKLQKSVETMYEFGGK